MSIRISVSGDRELLRALQKAKNIESDVKHIVTQETSRMERMAVNYAPYDTGFLKRSIESFYTAGGLAGTVEAYADYAVYQEYGTRFQPGKAFIRPAFNIVENMFLYELRRLVR